MHLLILGLLILLLVFGPQLWVRRTLKKYSVKRYDLPGTGGELAEHLVKRFALADIVVREGGKGEDYYDPKKKLISLSPDHYSGRSVAAVAVATHEVGHALQHQQQHPGFMKRQRRLALALFVERLSAIALIASPVLFLITRVPQSTVLILLVGLAGMLASLWVQVINLPIEHDASFNKALPILAEGYLSEQDLPAARKVLKAAAMTYLAAALASFLNIGRWLAILLRR